MWSNPLPRTAACYRGGEFTETTGETLIEADSRPGTDTTTAFGGGKALIDDLLNAKPGSARRVTRALNSSVVSVLLR